MQLFDCFMDDFHHEKYVSNLSDLDIRAQLEGVFFFSCIWAMGGTLFTESKEKFDLLFRGLLERDFPISTLESLNLPFEIAPSTKPYIYVIPTAGSVFDYKYIKEVLCIDNTLLTFFCQLIDKI